MRTHLRSYLIITVVLSLLSAPVFYRLSQPGVRSDLLAHAHLARGMVENGGWFSYSLWYPLFHFLSFGSDRPGVVVATIVILLTAFTVLKGWVVFWIAQRHLASTQLSVLVALVVGVVMPMIDPSHPANLYLGQVSANVWHNSTNVMVAPFAIAAFYAGIVFLQRLTIRSALIFSGLVMLSTLCKPNFSLALLPVIGIATIVIVIRRREAVAHAIKLILIAFAPVAALLILQFTIVFLSGTVRDTTLGISPFVVWSHFSANISYSLALSLAGPILMLLAMSPLARRSLEIQISWFALLVAIAQYALLVEVFPNGDVSFEGNWTWGSYTTITVVFVFSLIHTLRQLSVPRLDVWPRVALFLAGLAVAAHTFSGIYYLLNVAKTINTF
ncbi:hypothetical protein [Mycetocola sp. JXN-3]|uniref:hypothetical protein n=1 Tax=Mycetocola sp. JXN-3 TaxID=2116510 RepID=UPI00165D05B5|nr:hypothetical protein [Mycetocola sp. JXN-3]